MIFIVVKFTARPEYADKWLDLTADFTAATRAEPGNIFFDWSRSVDDPNVYVLTEGFQNDAAEAHVTSEHFKQAMAVLPKAIATTPQIINATIPQDGWGDMAELKPA